MRPSRRFLSGVVFAGLFGTAALAREVAEYDAAAPSDRGPANPQALARIERAPLAQGTTLRMDERYDVPSFLWASRSEAGPGVALTKPALTAKLRPEDAARRHLQGYAALYRMDGADVDSATLAHVHDTGRGGIVVSFRRALDGIEVFRDEMRVLLDRNLDLVAISGSLPGAASLPVEEARQSFRIDAATAAAKALADVLEDPSAAASDLTRVGPGDGGYELFDLAARLGADLAMPEPCRVKRVYFRLAKSLEPAYYVELTIGARADTNADGVAYVFSAQDGRLLFRHDLTVADSFSYRVWADTTGIKAPLDGPQGNAATPHPTGVPDGYQEPFVPPPLLSLQNGPISTNDPWLPPASLETTGNNVDAYADLASPDGLSAGDFRADTTSSGTFDRTYDPTLAPQVSQNQEKASIAQLFYDVNFFHDWYYDSGFDEVSGNAQASNFGRGGLQNDAIHAEAQDFGGRNNANMMTPSDGSAPRMQMYIFTGRSRQIVHVNAPAAIVGDYVAGSSSFGPAVFTATAGVVLVNDGSGTTSDGCQTPFTNAAAVSGKIAFIDRGTCNFTDKVKNAQLNGAIGAIVANNTTSGVQNMTGTDATITIPSLFLSQADGNTIRAQLGAGVNATLTRDPAVDRDGTLDNQIVAHEWGHYISNRLIGDAAGLNNNQGGGMGEGWGDFHALLLTTRPGDASVPSNPGFSGVYAMAGYTSSGGGNNGYYFGIRRVPYSTDFTKNALTFQHIANGVPLPPSVPTAFGQAGTTNAEVHNTGEVWATMLWECYVSLLSDTPRLTFDQARDRMRDYLVAGYKMTPLSPTLLEARDAVLAAAYAGDPADFARCSAAFARRGAGLRAVAPPRFASDNVGVVESYATGGDLALVSAAIVEDAGSCDADGVLDATEGAHLTLTLRNVGNSALNATTATISSSNGAVSFPAGTALAFPATVPFATTTAIVPIALGAAAGITPLDFTLSVSDPGLAFPASTSFGISFRGNYDDIPNQSATDDVESDLPRFSASGDPALSTLEPWSRLAASAFDHRWYGPDPGTTSDQYLVSPVLHVAASGSFSFTFRQRYSFEVQASPLVYFDGGVMEISTDAGAHWTDIGASAAPGYSATLDPGGTNPLRGRTAYAGASAGYPAFATVTVSLGTAYQGQNVLVRFRVGADEGVGAPGWEIDDIAFANITNLPFDVLVADPGVCVDSDGDGVVDRSDCAPADAGSSAIPSEARMLLLAGHASTALAWTPPASPGGSGLRYDLLRSTSAASFAGATCLESNDTDQAGVDSATPTGIFFYLVRAENACGGSLGAGSNGQPRIGSLCP